jgi:carboxyl-terminal processing protease
MWRENQLHGAFANPGPLGAGKSKAAGKMNAKIEAYSPPIKPQLIGTTGDAQLAAALKLLEKPKGANTTNSGSQRPI